MCVYMLSSHEEPRCTKWHRERKRKTPAKFTRMLACRFHTTYQKYGNAVCCLYTYVCVTVSLDIYIYIYIYIHIYIHT